MTVTDDPWRLRHARCRHRWHFVLMALFLGTTILSSCVPVLLVVDAWTLSSSSTTATFSSLWSIQNSQTFSLPLQSQIRLCIAADVDVDVTSLNNTDLMSALPTLPATMTPKHRRKENQIKRNRQKSNGRPPDSRNTTNDSHRLPKTIPSLTDILNEKAPKVHLEFKKNGPSKHQNKFISLTTKINPLETTAPKETVANPLPWRANYKSSTKTQGRIKKVFSTVTNPQHHHQQQQSLPHSLRAKAILDELLKTPPHFCNAVNLVCALTYSAKAMGTDLYHHNNPDPQLRASLRQTLDILHNLVVVHRDDQLLSPRQLCNVAWAIAKHCDRDPHLLPQLSTKRTTIQTSDMIFMTNHTSSVWEWNAAPLLDPNETEIERVTNETLQQCRLLETVDEIAIQLTSILVVNDVDKETMKVQESSFRKPKIKRGEICMACWAFGKLMPRNVPPGWHGLPKLGKVTTGWSTAEGKNKKRSEEMPIIKFESMFTSRKRRADVYPAYIQEESTEKSTADALFDAIAAALCNFSENVNGKISPPTTKDSILQECSWSELANIAWAYASHGQCRNNESEQLLMSLAEEAIFRLKPDQSSDNNCRPLIRDITQLLWSLGTLQADNSRLADGLARLTKALVVSPWLGMTIRTSFAQRRPLRRWSCADLVQSAVALAHARIDEQEFLRLIYDESIHRLTAGFSTSKSKLEADQASVQKERRSFHVWEASILLWAQARLHLTERQDSLFAEFSENTPRFFLQALRDNAYGFQKASIGPQEQANIVWALVVLEEYHSEEAVELIQRIFLESARSCRDDKSIQLEHAHQLWQAYFILREDCHEAVKGVPEWFVTYLREKWHLEKAQEKQSSARHRSLSNTLHLMGVDHLNEHDEDIDVAIILQPNAAWVHETESVDFSDETPHENVLRLAVEFDGPNHFTRLDGSSTSPDPPRALGHTILKYRLLKKQGWAVVRVPYYEFDKIPFWASMERQRYLQRMLKTHANLRFSSIDVSEYRALTPNRKSRFD